MKLRELPQATAQPDSPVTAIEQTSIRMSPDVRGVGFPPSLVFGPIGRRDAGLFLFQSHHPRWPRQVQ